MERIRIIKHALRLLRASLRTASSGKLAIRVAIQKLLADGEAEYDKLFRLQVLEGAAGVKMGTWWLRPHQGFKQAEDYFSGSALSPEWLSQSNTGMYNLLMKQTQAILSSKGEGVLRNSTSEVVGNALMGLKLDGSKRNKPMVWRAGENLASDIAAGKETPKKVGYGLLGTWMKNQALNEIKHYQRRQEQEGRTVRDDETGQIPDQTSGMSVASLAISLFLDRGDRLGKEIRNLMRKSWKGTTQEKGMNMWLGKVMEKGEFLGEESGFMREIAKAVGMKPWRDSRGEHYNLFRYWRTGWENFLKAFQADTRLQNKILVRARQGGIRGVEDVNFPDPAVMFPKRKRAFSLVRRVAFMHMTRQARG